MRHSGSRRGQGRVAQHRLDAGAQREDRAQAGRPASSPGGGSQTRAASIRRRVADLGPDPDVEAGRRASSSRRQPGRSSSRL
jgi:hypothetical protein